MTHIVKSYDTDLETLKNLVLTMASGVETQFEKALYSLETMDHDLAQCVIQQDHEINQLESQIDQLALQILALRQPVAFDLRMVIAVLKMANHLERMGDYAVNISRRVLTLFPQSSVPFLAPPSLLFRMGTTTSAMMRGVWEGFKKHDKNVMEKAWKADREVDRLYDTFLRDLLTHMIEDPRHISVCTSYLFIAKNIERMGDHVTNISEIIAIMVRGKPLKGLKRYSEGDPTDPSHISS